jgi:hypothetical protein
MFRSRLLIQINMNYHENYKYGLGNLLTLLEEVSIRMM